MMGLLILTESTATLPDSVPAYLPLTGVGSEEWYCAGKSLYHNQSSIKFPNLPPLHDLTIHQKISLQILTNGQLHIFIDEQHKECVATDLPVDKRLWGVVSINGYCTKIKSEMLSGELDTSKMKALKCTTLGGK